MYNKMKFKILTLSIVCFLLNIEGYSQSPDYPKNIEWDKAGVITEFPKLLEFDRIFYVPRAYAKSDHQNIQNAIDAAGAADGTNLVMLFVGKYTLDKPLVLEAGIHDNVYIKGAGPNHLMHSGLSTVLQFDFSDPKNFRIPIYGNINAAIVFKGGSDKLLGEISGYNSSTNQITIENSNTDLTADDFIRIRSNADGKNCREHPCMGQINRVKSIINTSPLTLELEHNFSLSWEQQKVYGGLELHVHKIDALQNVGISSVGIETINYLADPLPDFFNTCDFPKARESPQGHHILAFRVYNAHIKNLYSFKPIASHVYMIESYHNKVSESFFNEVVYSHGCSGGHGYGVNLFRKNTLNLIENNTFRHMRRALMFSRGVHKNVIGYNYSREIWAQTGNQDTRGDLSSRNWFDSGNLAEGNRVGRITNDVYHGEDYTQFKNVYFRNYTHYNFLQNEGGIQTYFIANQGEFAQYNDVNSISSDFDIYAFKNNLPHLTTIELNHTYSTTGYSDLDVYMNLVSLYHNEVPDFISQTDNYHLNYTWPPIGPALSNGRQLTQDIPARGRYCNAYNDYPDASYHCNDKKINGKP